MTAEEAATIEHRARAGEELQIGELAVLFGKSRSTIHRWLTNGADFGHILIKPRYRIEPGPTRLVDPRDVLAILDEMRRVRSADNPLGD